jgi:hypothetical protein
MTDTTPILEGWSPDEVPEGAGGDVGVVSRRATTNAKGIAIIKKWPEARAARIRILPALGQAFKIRRVIGGDHEGNILDERSCVAVPGTNEAVLVVVEEQSPNVIVASGIIRGISEERMRLVRLVRIGREGARAVGVMNVEANGRFTAKFRLWKGDMADEAIVHLAAEIPGEEWKVDLGTFHTTGQMRIDGIIIAKY